MARRRKPRAADPRQDDRKYVLDVITRIVDECPRRLPGTDSERRAQQMLIQRYEELGIRAELEPFEFHDHLYANLALHFGLGTLGSLFFGVAPAASLAMHTLAGVSYVGNATRRFYLLKRLLPRRASQNLVATLPARAEPRLRIVLMGHADAAFTGLLFDPRVVERLAGSGGQPSRIKKLLRKPMRLTTNCQFALAGLDALGIAMGPARHALWPAVGLLSIPGLLAFLVPLEIVLRNEAVPGANDNLSGSAALGVLAGRLAPHKPDDVELVFVVTGAEEAGTMGALALAKRKRHCWDPDNTVMVAVDALTNGQLCQYVEGEFVEFPQSPDLEAAARDVADADPRFAEFAAYHMPVGATDVAPFYPRGYECFSIGCYDPRLGSPRRYHHPSDTPQNLELDQLMDSIDFVEQFVTTVIRRRVG